MDVGSLRVADEDMIPGPESADRRDAQAQAQRTVSLMGFRVRARVLAGRHVPMTHTHTLQGRVGLDGELCAIP